MNSSCPISIKLSCQEIHKNQIPSSVRIRVSAIVICILASTLGSLMISGVPILAHTGAGYGWSLVSIGILLGLAGIAVKCVKKETPPPEPPKLPDPLPPEPDPPLERSETLITTHFLDLPDDVIKLLCRKYLTELDIYNLSFINKRLLTVIKNHATREFKVGALLSRSLYNLKRCLDLEGNSLANLSKHRPDFLIQTVPYSLIDAIEKKISSLNFDSDLNQSLTFEKFGNLFVALAWSYPKESSNMIELAIQLLSSQKLPSKTINQYIVRALSASDPERALKSYEEVTSILTSSGLTFCFLVKGFVIKSPFKVCDLFDFKKLARSERAYVFAGLIEAFNYAKHQQHNNILEIILNYLDPRAIEQLIILKQTILHFPSLHSNRSAQDKLYQKIQDYSANNPKTNYECNQLFKLLEILNALSFDAANNYLNQLSDEEFLDAEIPILFITSFLKENISNANPEKIKEFITAYYLKIICNKSLKHEHKDKIIKILAENLACIDSKFAIECVSSIRTPQLRISTYIAINKIINSSKEKTEIFQMILNDLNHISFPQSRDEFEQFQRIKSICEIGREYALNSDYAAVYYQENHLAISKSILSKVKGLLQSAGKHFIENMNDYTYENVLPYLAEIYIIGTTLNDAFTTIEDKFPGKTNAFKVAKIYLDMAMRLKNFPTRDCNQISLIKLFQ